MEVKEINGTKRNQRYKMNITCSKLKNDLKWFSNPEESSGLEKKESLFFEEKTINALVENWWINS